MEIEVAALEDLALLKPDPDIVVYVASVNERFVLDPGFKEPPNGVTIIDITGEESVWIKRERRRKTQSLLPSLLALATLGASSMPTLPRRSDSNESSLPRIRNDERALSEAEQKRARKAAKLARDAQRRRHR